MIIATHDDKAKRARRTVQLVDGLIATERLAKCIQIDSRKPSP